MSDAGVRRPSPHLLDTIYQCQQRQDWYRSFAQVSHLDPVEIVGTFTTATPVVEAGTQMRGKLSYGVDDRGSTWSDAVRALVERAEEIGVLVMVSGVVGSNTHRRLDPEEFRGFVLVDRMAPLVFINGSDTKAAQVFTLAHELAHVWLGETALDDAGLASAPAHGIEPWCNQVAAELLVPSSEVAAALDMGGSLTDQLERLARRFKVSTLVALRRVYDVGGLAWDQYQAANESELERVMALLRERGGGGGSFFNTQPARVSKR